MLKAYWWQPSNHANLGDEITSILLANYFGVDHVHADMIEAQLLSTGSLLNWIWERAEVRERTERYAIVGSGFMSPQVEAVKLANLQIYSVRGYLSKMVLGKNDHKGVSVGDPGLLMSRLPLEAPTSDGAKYGLIPHFRKVEDEQFLGRFDTLSDLRLIDLRTRDYKRILRQMQECEIILSQSLHGLILADALGKPNVWINHGALHSGGAFKFYDYFSSIDRPFHKGLIWGEPVDEYAIQAHLHTLPEAKLQVIQDDIESSFSRAISDLQRVAGAVKLPSMR